MTDRADQTTPSKSSKGGQKPSDRPSDTSADDPVERLQLMADEVSSLVHYVDQPTSTEWSAQRPDVSGDMDAAVDGLLRPVLVRASAGTGKTYQLTARLLRILLQGGSPETILATTFTRKAAGEILNRILITLATAADNDHPTALQKLRDQVGLPTLPASICRQLLTSLVSQIHRLRICTLDSLFAQLARSFPFELGLPPAWRQSDEIEELVFRQRAADAVIATLDPTEMTTLLAMLGKGDIKRSISRELLQVVDAAYSASRQCGPDAWEHLSVPTQPTAEALAVAVADLRAAKPKQKRLLTRLEELADQLEQRQFADLAGDTLVANIALARRMGTEVTFYRSVFPDGLSQAFDVLYAAVRSHVLALLRAQNEATATLLTAYHAQITELKQLARSLGFDDIAIRLASQFATIDQRVLDTRMDGAIDHVLLDEFQDTSSIQWQVLRPLATRSAKFDPEEAIDDHDAADHSFFCVGDTKQAIYGWRGGVAEIFDAVADQLPQITEVEQNKSYRTSPVVLNVINQTFQGLPNHPLAKSADAGDPADKLMYEALSLRRFARRFPTHESAHPNLPGFVSFSTARTVDDADVQANRMLLFADTATRVKELHQQAPHQSIGILTRTNVAVAQLIYLLERQGVEVSQEGGNPLTDSAAVDVVLSALMMAEHPGDGRWAFHVANSPLGKQQNLDADAIRNRLENRGIPETIEYLAGILAPQCDDRETERLKQLMHLALSYRAAAGSRVADFVHMVREKRVERPQSAPVRVMTVHQSKGLEFDAVFLPELDATLTRQTGHCVADVPEIGRPPEALTRYLNHKQWHFLPKHWQTVFGEQAEGQMTEALCLMYVAMTRARQAVYMMITPAKRKSFENRTHASLIYHALECDQDPSQPETDLLQTGDPHWYEAAEAADSQETDEQPSANKDSKRRTIRFRDSASPQPTNDSSNDNGRS
ncbi:MAG: UvrD-helicase domain-containing protein [Planctomycetota bacterium]